MTSPQTDKTKICNFQQKEIRFLKIILLFIILFSHKASLAGTLKTKNLVIKVTSNCPEGYVTCDEISYFGTDLKTKKSIKLFGKTLHSRCSDGVTPCRFLGYEFINGRYRYIITDNGILHK